MDASTLQQGRTKGLSVATTLDEYFEAIDDLGYEATLESAPENEKAAR